MKKITAALLALSLCIGGFCSFTACSDKETQNPSVSLFVRDVQQGYFIGTASGNVYYRVDCDTTEIKVENTVSVSYEEAQKTDYNLQMTYGDPAQTVMISFRIQNPTACRVLNGTNEPVLG